VAAAISDIVAALAIGKGTLGETGSERGVAETNGITFP
jgi:hypothetical protein